MTTPSLPSETDRLDPIPQLVDLVSGTKVQVLPLKLRQLFRLMRIITRGGSAYLPMLRDAMAIQDEDARSDALGTQLIAIALFALPDAEDEAVEFLMSCVEPDGLTPGRDKAQRAINEQLRRELSEELFNPEPEDAISIIEAVILREKNDLAALGKRLTAAFTMATKTGQLTEKPAVPSSDSTEQTPELSEVTPARSTSSRRNTGGRTKKSSTSASDE